MAQETTAYESAALGTAEWKGTSRYKALGCLGRGGMGAVYEVLDRDRGQTVALKTLLRVDAAGLYRFKHEFRTLADVHHPNLVRLYDLVIRGNDEIFFTMELVTGKEFTDYARGPAAPSAILTTQRREDGGLDRGTASPRRAAQADEVRLRSALCQLVAGVRALHAAGKLHRDIKPSNALVTDEGRLVLLDFGVATELSTSADESIGRADEMVGTAQYMAPEQADDTPPTPSSDWYSVGVMLYEALVGVPPFVGSAIEVLTMKSTMAAPLPSTVVDGVPPDLDALCRDLLDIEPNKRPEGDDILRRLGANRSASSAPPAAMKGGAQNLEIVGRAEPLRALADAYEAATAGRTVTVFVTGAPGMGKTRLVNHFVEGLVTDRGAVVLRGRSYEREAVPYKAFDAVMDSLSRHVMERLDAGDDLSFPEDCWLLGRLFPVLQRIPALDEMADAPVDNPQTVRRRAFAALRELLGSLSKRSPVVIFVDDVHWGDADSAALLLDLVRPPSTASLLVVMTHRDSKADSKEASPFLNEVRERWPAKADQRRLSIGPLNPEDAQRLALLLTDDGALAERSARAVARESQGQPFLIEELVRANRGHMAASGNQTLAILTVDDMISDRLDRMPESARQLAEIVAVGGRPLPISVTLRAAAIGRNDADTVVAMVCARRFARPGLHNGRDVLESTYDQIRERIVAQLPPAKLRQHHASLAQALQDAPGRDGEAIAEHWLAAGDGVKAAAFAREAAEHAFATFAFDQAIRLLRLALDNTPASSPEAHRIRLRLAQALQMAGRSTESGREYLRVAASAPSEQKLELRRIAAEQLLAAGRIEEGERILHDVLASCGMRAPRSPLAALFWLIVYSIWIRVRGYKFKEREPSAVSARDRMRVDALHTVGMGFGFVNSILAVCMQKRQCIEAMRVGDRAQVLIALAIQISHMANAGPRETERERALVRLARDLAKRAGGGVLDAYVDMGVGFGRFLRGHWPEAREMLGRAEEGLRHSGNRSLETNARIYYANVCVAMGDVPESWRRSSRLLVEAEDRNDLYMTATLRANVAIRHALVTGDTEIARARARDAMAQWPQTSFSVQHFMELGGVADIDVYEGRGGRAYENVTRAMPALKKSLLLGTWCLRVQTWHLRGRVAIASIASQPEAREARIDEARKMGRLLAREPNQWARSLGAAIMASAEIATGNQAAAIAELRRSVALAESIGFRSHALVARYRLGEILGGEEGRELVLEARRIFDSWGMKDVDRHVQTMLPGDIRSLRGVA